MAKRRKFTNEFKLEAVRLAERGDVPVSQVARDLDLHETSLRRWMALYGKRAGARGSLPLVGCALLCPSGYVGQAEGLGRLRRRGRGRVESREGRRR